MALINYKSELLNFNIDISDYHEIVIGSPIWNDRISSPINEVLDKLDLSKKNISFILYSGSGKANNAIKRIEKEYPKAKIIMLKEPKKDSNFKEKLNF